MSAAEHVLRKIHHCTFPVKFSELPISPENLIPSGKIFDDLVYIHHKNFTLT